MTLILLSITPTLLLISDSQHSKIGILARRGLRNSAHNYIKDTANQASKSPTIGLDSPLNIIAAIKPRNQNPKSIQPHQDFDFQTPILLKQGTLVA
jgi:hypothetical protein